MAVAAAMVRRLDLRRPKDTTLGTETGARRFRGVWRLTISKSGRVKRPQSYAITFHYANLLFAHNDPPPSERLAFGYIYRFPHPA